MPHARQKIRDQAVTELTGLATTGSRVYPSRIYPLQEAELPALLVYAHEEESEPFNLDLDGRILERSLTLTVTGVAQATSGIEDTLDQIAAEVEAALGLSMLNGLAADLYLAGTRLELSGEGDQPTGSIHLDWRVLYRTMEKDPLNTL